MSEIVNLSAERRGRAGKGAARATRRAGRVPGIVYGNGKDPVAISLEPKALERELVKPSFLAALIDLQLDGAVERALPRDVQRHPVSGVPLHVDFLRVGPGTQVTVSVPVAFINQERSPGLRRGGILNIVRHGVELRCVADAIPERLIVDLEGLDIGDSVHISRVTLPPGSRPTITGRDFTIASVAPSSAVREEAAATPGETAAAS
jgi:large subunit ribosomal protein L25